MANKRTSITYPVLMIMCVGAVIVAILHTLPDAYEKEKVYAESTREAQEISHVHSICFCGECRNTHRELDAEESWGWAEEDRQ